MVTINLHSFKGNHFHDLYVYIMKTPAISYKVVIPRNQNHSQRCPHFINNMEFTCAAYAFQLLSEIATDFSYTVPSAYKSNPFECFIETPEPEKLIELIYWLLCAYNPDFALNDEKGFHFEAGQFFRRVFKDQAVDVAAWGLMAVGWEEWDMWLGVVIGEEE